MRPSAKLDLYEMK